MLEQAGRRRPAADAIVEGRRRLTYADLVDQATRLGRGFARLGVGKGDRVLIVLKNRLEHVLAYWALQMIGGVPTPAGFRLAAREVRYILDDCGASVVLFEAATADAVQEAAAGHQARLVFVGNDGPAGSLPFDELLASGATGAALDRELAEGDLSLILYTSGTTGRPKGVPRTHRNHVAGALAHVIQCGYGWLERTLGVMPLYHTMGIHSLTSMAAVNGCFVCQPDWSGEGALALIESERLTALYLIPTLFYDLVRAPGFAPARVSSVRKLAYAGAFAAPPAGLAGVYVITPNEGLRRADELVDLARLRGFAQVDIDAADARYHRPLRRDAGRVAAALGPAGEAVLLGSVATGKYVDPLTEALRNRLRFPADFVGRGDMSRGGLLLRCVRAGRELVYVPVAGALRRGGRPARLERP